MRPFQNNLIGHWSVYGAGLLAIILIIGRQRKPIMVMGYNRPLHQEVIIRTETSGVVVNYIKDQQFIRKNQLILELATDKIDQKIHMQQQKIQAYEMQLNHLIQALETASKSSLIQQKTEIKTEIKTATITKLETQIQELLKSNEQLLMEKQFFQSKASISGTISWHKEVNEGTFIQAGAVLATLIGQDSIFGIFKLNKQQFKKLNPDQPVVIKSLSEPKNQSIQQGIIKQITPLNNGQSYQITCKYLNDQAQLGHRSKVIGYFSAKSIFN